MNLEYNKDLGGGQADLEWVIVEDSSKKCHSFKLEILLPGSATNRHRVT